MPPSHHGLSSLWPPTIAIALAIASQRVLLALALFVVLGQTVLQGWNPLLGVVAAVDATIAVVADADNLRLLLFSLLIGAIVSFAQISGGTAGFARWAESLGLTRSPRRVQLFTIAVSAGVFVESWFGLLVSGAVARPLCSRAGISPAKLSYLLDATCAPKCMLLPLNAWGAYVVTLLASEGFKEPMGLLLEALPFNLYAIVAILLALVVAVFDWNIGPMRRFEAAYRMAPVPGTEARDTAALDQESLEPAPGTPSRAFNLLLPLVVMIAGVFGLLAYTGGGRIAAGSGPQSLFWAVVLGLTVSALAYRLQGVVSGQELGRALRVGTGRLLPLVAVLVLAFTIGRTSRALGTGTYLAEIARRAALPRSASAALIFVISCLIAFSTGTSWGTFAIMIPIAVPMIRTLRLHQGLTLGATLGGGIFGDHCSPISDSTVVASMAAGAEHGVHVRSQLPYALLAASIALGLTLVLGAVL